MTNTTLGKEGLGQQPWWVVEWMELENKRIGAQYHRWFHVRDPGHTRNILEQL